MLEFLKFLVVASVAGFFVLQSIGRTKNKHGENEFSLKIPPMITGGVALIAFMIGMSSFGTLGAGERGVVLRLGAVTGRVLQPGLYGVIPVIESVHAMDVQIQKEMQKCQAVSKDMQQVTTEVAINYSYDPDKVPTIYKTLGDRARDRVIDPAIQEAVKATTAKFSAEQLIAVRHEVKDVLELELSTRLAENGILVEAVSLTDFAFTADFTEAIEQKVTATQNALKAENDLKRVRFEADQAVATARGEAEAIRIKVAAIKEQGGEEYVKLKAIEKWNGSVPQWVTGGGAVPFINMAGPK